MDTQTDMANDLLKREVSAQLFGISLQSQDSFSVTLNQTRERLDRPFRVARRFTLPIGREQDSTWFMVRWQTANRRVLALNGNIGFGEFYDGTRESATVNLTVRMRPGYIVYLTGQFNDIDVPEGRVTTRLYRVVGETQFTPSWRW